MPVMKKEFEVGEKKIWVRQASGMERLHFETILAKTFRKFRHFGTDQSNWTESQQEEFLEELEAKGGSMQDQIHRLVPPCILDGNLDINVLDRDELMDIFNFVRGEEQDGAIPLDF